MYVGEGNCEDFFECDMHALKWALPPSVALKWAPPPQTLHSILSLHNI